MYTLKISSVVPEICLAIFKKQMTNCYTIFKIDKKVKNELICRIEFFYLKMFQIKLNYKILILDRTSSIG